MAEYQEITDGRPDGALIGHSSTEKVGFFGATPVVRQTAITALSTTAPTSTSGNYGYTLADATAIKTAITALNTALTNLGLVA